MNVNVKFEANLHYFFSKKFVIFVSLLFLLVLVFSSSISVVIGASITSDVVVKNEMEILNAISEAPNKKSHIISLSENITLKNSLEIPKNKNITLIAFGGSDACLRGSNDIDTIVIKSGGILVLLDNIVVTHEEDAIGRGLCVESGGTLILSGGEIFGNTVNASGGGVYNQGDFKMYSGKISNNTVYINGGGMYNAGSFVMSGGEISDNTASSWGGGVLTDSRATFIMSGGQITHNTAGVDGGGVFYFSGDKGTFTLLGGEIFDNTATLYAIGNNLAEVSVHPWTPFTVINCLLFIIVAVIVTGILLLLYRLKRQKRFTFYYGSLFSSEHRFATFSDNVFMPHNR
ncbi:MAG: autotransporter adhesin family protein [Nitrososphaerota archaeon]|jgi:hypothetical protein|nr:autotransporter adhesin family protein [Nitrososphaerota archaeon]